MILGITGGTGCGKTTLLQLIGDQGGMVLDCDAIYHQLLSTDAQLLSQIEARFPGTVENGILQRKKLGNLVFSDSSALEDLNKITHSAVVSQVRRSLASKPSLAAIDAIALFESGLDQLCDITVAVTAPTEDRVQRLMARDGISQDYARRRIAAQREESWFREKCSYVLTNDGSPAQFRDKCLAFLQQLGIIGEEIIPKGEIDL
ncbi:MAG TPA: dephospho-CoA kinase [Candidatus Faecousia faecavium]|nr:dephospho-CoA kinase [Candidatus Faecousia faecavium]